MFIFSVFSFPFHVTAPMVDNKLKAEMCEWVFVQFVFLDL